MNLPIIKAFVLCENVSAHAASTNQKDLQGAGLSRFECEEALPARFSFWVFVQMSDWKETGKVQLVLMRADSGRRYYFRAVTVQHTDAVQATICCIRLFDCMFPERGVYFIELWYDDVWVIDQRLEIV